MKLQPYWTFEAHLGRIVHTSWAKFQSSLLISVGNEPNLALWSDTSLVKRVTLPFKVNWLETSEVSAEMFVAGTEKEIGVLAVQG